MTMVQKDKQQGAAKKEDDCKEDEREEEEKKGNNIHQETPEIREANQIIENFPRATVEVVGLKMYQNIGTMYMQSAVI